MQVDRWKHYLHYRVLILNSLYICNKSEITVPLSYGDGLKNQIFKNNISFNIKKVVIFCQNNQLIIKELREVNFIFKNASTIIKSYFSMLILSLLDECFVYYTIFILYFHFMFHFLFLWKSFCHLRVFSIEKFNELVRVLLISVFKILSLKYIDRFENEN